MKTYLGDAVYLEINDLHDVILTTSDGVNITNRIVLEPEIYGFLLNAVTLEMKRRRAAADVAAREEGEHRGD